MKKCLHLCMFTIYQILMCQYCDADRTQVSQIPHASELQDDELSIRQKEARLLSSDKSGGYKEEVDNEYLSHDDDMIEDQKSESIIDNNVKSGTLEGDTTNEALDSSAYASELELQKQLYDSSKFSKKNIEKLKVLDNSNNLSEKNTKELEVLNESKIVVTKENLKELEAISSGEESKTIALSIDLLNNVDNFKAALIAALSAALENKDIRKGILGETNQFKKYLENTQDIQTDEMVVRLTEFQTAIGMKIATTVAFYQFISAMRLMAILAKNTRDAIFLVQAVQELIVNNMFSKESKISGGLGFSAVINGVKVGGKVGVEKTIGLERDFNEGGVHIGKGINEELSVGFSLAFIEAIGKLMTQSKDSQIFHSVLAYLLNRDLGGSILAPKDIKNASNALKDLQALQARAISAVGVVLNFLKAAKCVPNSVNIVYPDLTKPVSVRHANTQSVALEGMVKLLQKLGLSAKIEKISRDTERRVSLLECFDEHFNLTYSNVKSKEKFIEIIGEKYNLSEKFGGKSTPENLPIILGYVRNYLWALNVLESARSGVAVDKKDVKQAEESKKEIETFLNTKGREGVLLTLICTMMALTDATDTERAKLSEAELVLQEVRRELELRAQVFNALLELLKFQTLSKDKHNTNGTYVERSEESLNVATFALVITVPGLGDFSANVRLYPETVFDEETKTKKIRISKIRVYFDTPLAFAGFIAKLIMQKLLNVGDRIDASDIGSMFKLLVFDAWQSGALPLVIRTVLHDKLGVGMEMSFAKLMAKTNVTSKSRITIEFNRVPDYKGANVQNLPGLDNHIEKNINFSIGRIDVQVFSNLGINDVSLSGVLVDGGRQQSEMFTLFGSNTFEEWTKLYHQTSLAAKDTETLTGKYTPSEDPIWKYNLSAHNLELLTLCRNVLNPKSNAAFELQCMYNNMLNNSIGNSKETNEVNTVTEAFMKACTAFNDMVSNDIGDMSRICDEAQKMCDKIKKKEKTVAEKAEDFINMGRNVLTGINEVISNRGNIDEKAPLMISDCDKANSAYDEFTTTISEESRSQKHMKSLLELCKKLRDIVAKYYPEIKADPNKMFGSGDLKLEESKQKCIATFSDFMNKHEALVTKVEEDKKYEAVLKKKSIKEKLFDISDKFLHTKSKSKEVDATGVTEKRKGGVFKLPRRQKVDNAAAD